MYNGFNTFSKWHKNVYFVGISWDSFLNMRRVRDWKFIKKAHSPSQLAMQWNFLGTTMCTQSWGVLHMLLCLHDTGAGWRSRSECWVDVQLEFVSIRCLWIPLVYYSRVHISSDTAFFKIMKKPSIVQKKTLPHMNLLGIFHWEKTTKKNFEQPNDQKLKK